MYSHSSAWANLHILGQPNAFLNVWAHMTIGVHARRSLYGNNVLGLPNNFGDEMDSLVPQPIVGFTSSSGFQ
jgi:hypothetical protein